ncbi:hypothetical protein JNJ66_01110 [Candidatus Saccharibacteria bacterium]|nr:hypothetical protein [Candidatus Saccharibacteria bacterium]
MNPQQQPSPEQPPQQPQYPGQEPVQYPAQDQVPQQPYGTPVQQPADPFAGIPPVNPAFTPSPAKANKGMKIAIIGGVAGLLLLVGLPVALLTFSGVQQRAKQAKTDQSARAALDTDTKEPAGSKTEPAKEPVKSSEVKLADKNFTDELGYKTSVTRLIRNYPVTSEYERESLAKDGLELVMAEYTIENVSSEVSGGSPFASDLQMMANGKAYSQSYLVLKDDLKKAGYTPLPSTNPKAGEPVTGVVLYEVPKGAKLSLFYHMKVNVIGGDDVDKEYKLDLF